MVKEIYQFPSTDLPQAGRAPKQRARNRQFKKTPFSSTLPQAVGKIYQTFNRPIRAFIHLLLQLIVILSVMF